MDKQKIAELAKELIQQLSQKELIELIEKIDQYVNLPAFTLELFYYFDDESEKNV